MLKGLPALVLYLSQAFEDIESGRSCARLLPGGQDEMRRKALVGGNAHSFLPVCKVFFDLRMKGIGMSFMEMIY